jgi:hypothetical protein
MGDVIVIERTVLNNDDAAVVEYGSAQRASAATIESTAFPAKCDSFPIVTAPKTEATAACWITGTSTSAAEAPVASISAAHTRLRGGTASTATATAEVAFASAAASRPAPAAAAVLAVASITSIARH